LPSILRVAAIEFQYARADTEVAGNVLAGMAGEHQLHDLALARGQTGEALRCHLPPNRQLGRIPGVFQDALDAGEQFAAADWEFAVLGLEFGDLTVAVGDDQRRVQSVEITVSGSASRLANPFVGKMENVSGFCHARPAIFVVSFSSI
jgi:hypothetical protein